MNKNKALCIFLLRFYFFLVRTGNWYEHEMESYSIDKWNRVLFHFKRILYLFFAIRILWLSMNFA